MRSRTKNAVVGVGICFACTVAFFIAFSQERVSSHLAPVPDARFRFTFCSVTQGTNHHFFSGSTLLARLNGSLVAAGLQPITDDRKHLIQSSSSATILTVGYLFDAGATNPPSPIAMSNVLTAVLVKRDGIEAPITRSLRSTLAGRPGEHISHWLLPPSETNLVNCKLRFNNRWDGKHVATFDL